MSAINFCDACLAFIQGSWREVKNDDPTVKVYMHHETAESFQLALDLKCVICLRLWAAFRRGDAPFLTDEKVTEEVLDMGPTTYDSPASMLGLHDTCNVDFYRGHHKARLTLCKWSDQSEKEARKVVSKNKGDDLALRFFITQYKQCLAEHISCQQPTSCHNFVPTRVIDVGRAGDESVRLCERDSLIAEVGYVALSHCWGKVQPITLTKATTTSLKNGISIASLPKTFQDAIIVTKKFQHRYLWIDSLCIIQDDTDDWHTESSTMHDVYSNAAFCIAATAAQDGNVGLFVDRDSESLTPIKVQLKWHPSQPQPYSMRQGDYQLSCHWIIPEWAVDAAPLNQRAWVAQERHLSRRILHFARELLFWECRESFTCENHPDALTHWVIEARNLKLFLHEHKTRSATGTDTDPEDDHRIYYRWCQFRAFYTNCQLSYGEDILIALRGISQEVADALHDEMIVGLWKNFLIKELCWYCPDTSMKPRRPSYPGPCPSWTWVTSTKPTASNILVSHGALRSLGSMVVVVDIRVDTTLPGDFSRTSIIINCRLIPASYTSALTSIKHDKHVELSDYPLHVYFDDAAPSVENSKSNLRCYLLILLFGPYNAVMLEGLIIVPCTDSVRAYKRIGYFQFRDSTKPTDFSKISDFHDAMEEQTIELI